VEKPDIGQRVAEKYARNGHPSIEELVAEQGAKFRADPVELLGDFWPEEESIDDFLRALHEWRGHGRPPNPGAS
jgi:predicted RNA polymerase sigma factor